MTKLLYLRLASNNLIKNRQTYLPFILASTLLTFAQYSFFMITFNPGFSEVHGGMQFVVILQFGIFVVALFTAIFLFYANSFLIKRRKKELGLYSILGMEKKHIGRVIRHELSLCYVTSMVAGLALGVLLTRLMFLLIRLLMRIDVPLVGTVSWPAMVGTLVLFAALYLLLMLYNSWQVRSVSPIELLRGGQIGEREPKARWLLAVIGVACMVGGYWIAQRVNNPMSAIALFFVAVILVILGTYLLFIAGSLAVLKFLKSRKSFYYKSQHFITISGLLYRMKQNAAGLASIAILSTMAMITIGTTFSLYNGSEKMLNEYYPYDMQISLESTEAQEKNLAFIEEASRQTGVSVQECYAYTSYETTAAMDQNQLDVLQQEVVNSLDGFGRLVNVVVLTADNYEKVEQMPIQLGAQEIAWYCDKKLCDDTLLIADKEYQARRLTTAEVPNRACSAVGSAFTRCYLVVNDDVTARSIIQSLMESEDDLQPTYMIQWNLEGDNDAKLAYGQAYSSGLSETGWLRDKASLRGEWYAMHGGFLFTGVFLGLIFLMGTALILYFKQVSEGYQDHDRFIILQKVGMSQEEVKRTVGKQILLVFFLPLVVAICHVAGAVHMIALMLMLFGLVDVPYIALNSIGAALGVAALYWLFYHRTAKTYYKLVKF